MKLTSQQKNGILLIASGLIGLFLQPLLFNFLWGHSYYVYMLPFVLNLLCYGLIILGIFFILLKSKTAEDGSLDASKTEKNNKRIITIVHTLFSVLFIISAIPIIFLVLVYGDFSHNSPLQDLLFLLVFIFPISNIFSIIFSWKGYKENNHKKWLYAVLIPWIHLIIGLFAFFILMNRSRP